MNFYTTVCLAVLLTATQAVAQEGTPAASSDVIRVYLDCRFCDDDFIRTEINYVHWVRDRADADVHVIVSSQETGGGGDRYTLTFTGLQRFAAREDTLVHTSKTTDSQDDRRRALTHRLELGLVPFIATTSTADRLQISWTAREGESQTPAQPVDDPWNLWVFTLRLNSNLNGEESQKFQFWSGNISANRTAADWKLRFGLRGSYNEQSFSFFDGEKDTTVVSIRKSYSARTLAVRSFSEHWSAGFEAGTNTATFGNISLGVSGGPAVEYSLWPYAEATRRSLVFRYSVGARRFDYREITIYDRLQETRPSHALTSELDLRQRWGSMSVETSFSQYLDNTAFYRANVFADAEIQLFRGLSFNFFGAYTRIRDQLSLAKEDLTPEEVLTQQRELRTGYRYFAGLGLSYSFGSIYNNIVNPRFGEGDSGIVVF